MSAPLIRYFRDCYEEDNRRAVIWNVFGRTIEHRLFCSGSEDILTGDLHRIPVDPEEGGAAQQAAQLYQKEKELLYVSLFVVGTLEKDAGFSFGGKRQRICAPLIALPTRFVEDPPFLFAEPEVTDVRLNEELLGSLPGVQDEPDRLEEIRAVLRDGIGALDLAPRLALLLRASALECDTSLLDAYPDLGDEQDLRRLFKEASRGDAPFRLVPASAMVLAPRSRATRGVISELETLAGATHFSPPLRMLFGQAVDEKHPGRVETGWVPAVLSHAQKRVLASGVRHPVTVVIGPPGTGKSYTIAALAVEHFSRGERVLIASKMDHAVDVIADKLERQLGMPGCAVRGGKRSYLKELKGYLQQLLSGMHTAEVPLLRDIIRSKKELTSLERQLEKLERDLEAQIEKERRWGRQLSAPETSLVTRLGTRWARWRASNARPLWQRFDQLERTLQHRVARARDHLVQVNKRRLADTLHRYRKELITFDKALRARTSGRQANLFEQTDFRVLLNTFPIWLVNLADVSKVLPLREALFDVVIIDEATQCDIASCLPVLQRARRAVIVGDPNQLRHISFLAERRQQALADKQGLSPEEVHLYDYRRRSILDLYNDRVSMQEHVAFLDEHFRSVPEIIGFSNARFYGDRLRIMTEKPGHRRVPGFVFRPCAGSRNQQGVNTDEVRALTKDVRMLVAEETGISAGACRSIGVLSPFRDQVNALGEALARELPAGASAKHRLMVGTAHTFQGEERDVMFLSLAVGAEAHPSALRFLERADVFNVAVTRARVAQYVYCSLDPAALEAGTLLADYLQHVLQAREGTTHEPSAHPAGFHDSFAEAVARALQEQGITVRIGYPMAGLTLDVVAYKGAHSCGIDLVGYPGPYEDAFALERYKMFSRAGLPLVPLSYARWLIDRAGCLRAMTEHLEPSGAIFPATVPRTAS